MARTSLIAITALVVIVTIISQGVSAIKCWQCSSHVPFCDDPFNADNVTAQQRAWAYKECILSDGQSRLNNQRPVCKKLKQLVYDKFVITRSCYWKNEDAPIEECLENLTPQHIKTEFCEACDHDGCNGAAQYGPVFLVIALPLIIATFISF